jgi:hypothetical protein
MSSTIQLLFSSPHCSTSRVVSSSFSDQKSGFSCDDGSSTSSSASTVTQDELFIELELDDGGTGTVSFPFQVPPPQDETTTGVITGAVIVTVLEVLVLAIL